MQRFSGTKQYMHWYPPCICCVVVGGGGYCAYSTIRTHSYYHSRAAVLSVTLSRLRGSLFQRSEQTTLKKVSDFRIESTCQDLMAHIQLRSDCMCEAFVATQKGMLNQYDRSCYLHFVCGHQSILFIFSLLKFPKSSII